MEAFVANKVADYQQGRISRRQLIESLTVAAATAYTAEGAKADNSHRMRITAP